MKWVYTFLIIIFLIVGCSSNRSLKEAKYSNIITKYTKIYEIPSSEVNDTFYVFVRLPKHYKENPNKNYPVLYLLDGDISFNMATSVVRYLQFGKDIPDMIIVSPAYGTLLSDGEKNYRERDYTFSAINKFENSGGGKNYVNFIEKELIPFVDKNFRTNKKRILNGYSLGGLFVINILLRKPNIFTDYIAGSPYLINDIEGLLNIAADSNFTENKKIFISVGENESFVNYHKPINKIYSFLSHKKLITVNFRNFKNGTHFTCPPEALAYGLKFIFN